MAAGGGSVGTGGWEGWGDLKKVIREPKGIVFVFLQLENLGRPGSRGK